MPPPTGTSRPSASTAAAAAEAAPERRRRWTTASPALEPHAVRPAVAGHGDPRHHQALSAAPARSRRRARPRRRWFAGACAVVVCSVLIAGPRCRRGVAVRAGAERRIATRSCADLCDLRTVPSRSSGRRDLGLGAASGNKTAPLAVKAGLPPCRRGYTALARRRCGHGARLLTPSELLRRIRAPAFHRPDWRLAARGLARARRLRLPRRLRQ